MKQTYGHGEKGGVGEMYGKSNMEIYIMICKIDSHIQGSRNLNRDSINLERWDGERDGREVQKGGDISIPMADSC